MVTETSERGRRGDVDVEMVGDFVGTNTPYHRKHFTFSLNSSAKTAKKLRENGRQQSLCDSGFAGFSAKNMVVVKSFQHGCENLRKFAVKKKP
jgi:hypothetical protein